ncbi:MAG: diacylglycerol kinase family lipid kinase [Acidobacteria bacterium]|nr:MAG: diacylglycerol kinase family lipid kinase [Acidobacteriota bacterium]
MKLLVIANPSAGRGRCARRIPDIRAAVEGLRGAQFCVSQSVDHLISLARQGVHRRVDVIVACGGDGTVHHIVQTLSSSGAALGVIPVGTGNDIARHLGLPTDIRSACEVLQRGKPRPVDVARVGFGGAEDRPRIYLSVAGVGLDAEVNRLAQRGSRWLPGKTVYLYAALRALSKFTPRHMEVTCDAYRFRGEMTLVAVGNTSSYGGGLKILPQAKPDDGWLDVCLVKKASRVELLQQFPRLYAGTHIHHPAVEIRRARCVTLSSVDHLELFADGEYICNLPVTIEIAPQSLSVIAP